MGNIAIITAFSILVAAVLGMTQLYTYNNLKKMQDKFQKKISKDLAGVAKNATKILKKDGEQVLAGKIGSLGILKRDFGLAMRICYPINQLMGLSVLVFAAVASAFDNLIFQVIFGMFAGTLFFYMVGFTLMAIVTELKIARYLAGETVEQLHKRLFN